MNPPANPSLETATFGGGCFWCVEAVYKRLEGVKEAVSGYMGGSVPEPTYEQVCSGNTGHAEVVRITFDPSIITYRELLDWFWRLHDPTTPDRQGNDVGPQYRSVIFYHSEEQREAAEQSKRQAGESGTFSAPIVTEVSPAGRFYPAEPYHHDYYDRNPAAGYCRVIIRPKLEKLGFS